MLSTSVNSNEFFNPYFSLYILIIRKFRLFKLISVSRNYLMLLTRTEIEKYSALTNYWLLGLIKLLGNQR